MKKWVSCRCFTEGGCVCSESFAATKRVGGLAARGQSVFLAASKTRKNEKNENVDLFLSFARGVRLRDGSGSRLRLVDSPPDNAAWQYLVRILSDLWHSNPRNFLGA